MMLRQWYVGPCVIFYAYAVQVAMCPSIYYTQITTCYACQRMNRRITTVTPEFHLVPVKVPWYHVGIDFVGPVTTLDSGNRYILTLSDYCSKWVEAVSMPSKHASGVLHALFKVNVFVITS